MGTTVGEISCCLINDKSFVLYISDDLASAIRGLVAAIKRQTGGRGNIVCIRGTIDHDVSGIKDTIVEEAVSSTVYHLNIQTIILCHEPTKTSVTKL